MGAMVGALPVSFTIPWMVPPLETVITVYGSARASCARSNVPLRTAALHDSRRVFEEVFSKYRPTANSITIPPNAISIDLDRQLFSA
jgi:hypothetical protein